MKSKTGKPAEITLIDAHTHIALSDSASFPEARFESEDELQTRADELQTRAARKEAIREFVEAQRRKRESISFAEIAEWYRNMTGRTDQEAQAALRKSVELGDFETENGGSRIIFRHQAVSEMPMTRSMLQTVIEIFSHAPKEERPNNTVWDQYLSHCWISAADARKWFEAQCLSAPNVIGVTDVTLPSGTKSAERSIEVTATEPLAVESVSTSPCRFRSRRRDREKRQTIEQAITTLKIDPSSAKPADVAKRIWGESGKRQESVFGLKMANDILDWYGGPTGRQALAKMIVRILEEAKEHREMAPGTCPG